MAFRLFFFCISEQIFRLDVNKRTEKKIDEQIRSEPIHFRFEFESATCCCCCCFYVDVRFLFSPPVDKWAHSTVGQVCAICCVLRISGPVRRNATQPTMYSNRIRE